MSTTDRCQSSECLRRFGAAAPSAAPARAAPAGAGVAMLVSRVEVPTAARLWTLRPDWRRTARVVTSGRLGTLRAARNRGPAHREDRPPRLRRDGARAGRTPWVTAPR